MSNPTAQRDRELLVEAQSRGFLPTLSAYTRLSGPGWLQSAITLGGGSLAGSLFLGVLGGTDLLWLQLVAIVMGVIMLSAISYVTLSTGQRPFRAINQHINPVLGWGWLIATIMANMIWCMPQFGLCFAALERNLLGSEIVSDDVTTKSTVSIVLLVAAGIAVFINRQHGIASKIFDWLLKILVGMVVICFFGVVIYLTKDGLLDWPSIWAGFIPNLASWSQPTGDIQALLQDVSQEGQDYWSSLIVKEQRAVMIGAAATAVGINMTFLMPYSMLNRGWDKPFRGLARFDLSTGMAIPYVLVTSCVVIAAAASFHTKIDDDLLSTDLVTMQQSPMFEKAAKIMLPRIESIEGAEAFAAMSDEEKISKMAALSNAEKRVASSLIRRDAFELSQSLAPLLGETNAKMVFGIGIFAMGFSTIIILMLINGFAFCEMFDAPLDGPWYIVGCLVAGISGASWFMIWDGDAKLWLAILASSFGMMLLPIAYVTFLIMMNSRSVMGDEKPQGLSLVIWNVLMTFSVAGAIVAAGTAIQDKASDPTAGTAVISIAAIFVVLVIAGFIFKRPLPDAQSNTITSE